MTESYFLSEKERSSIFRLDGPERYRHFVSRVADWQQVWGLRDESGWVAASDDAGNRTFPVWPHPDYAKACATGEWDNNIATAIEVHEFVDRWLPDMESQDVHVAVFPIAESKGVVVPAHELQEILLKELEKYD